MSYPDSIREAIRDDSALLSFLFHIGDSSDGPIGASFRVRAQTPEQAVVAARSFLRRRSAENRFGYDDAETKGFGNIQYFALYLNPDTVSESNIDKSETEICGACLAL